MPWKRRLGYASSALRRILPEARVIGLPYVEVTMDVDNLASQHVVLANGGVLVETFTKPAAFGSTTALRFRIDLARPTANLKSTVGQ